MRISPQLPAELQHVAGVVRVFLHHPLCDVLDLVDTINQSLDVLTAVRQLKLRIHGNQRLHTKRIHE